MNSKAVSLRLPTYASTLTCLALLFVSCTPGLVIADQPAQPAITLSVSGNNATLGFFSRNGIVYGVEGSDDLNAGWASISSGMNGNNTTLSQVYTSSGPRKFFRISVTAPMLSISVNSTGTLASLMGINMGPVPSGSQSNAELTAAYQTAGVNLIRTHDFGGPFDMSTLYANQTISPTAANALNFTATDAIFQKFIDGGFNCYLRLGDSYSNSFGYPAAQRKPSNSANWVNAAVEVVRHYSNNSTWGRNAIESVEIWNEPDTTHFWSGNATEFAALFCDTLESLKSAFPNLTIGGPGLAGSATTTPQGQAFINTLLSTCQSRSLTPDFLSCHYYGNTVAGFTSVIAYLRGRLDAYGFTGVPLHISEWNTDTRTMDQATALPWRTGCQGASLLTAAWCEFQKLGIKKSCFYRGPDPSSTAPEYYGAFYSDGSPKKIARAMAMWSQVVNFPTRCDVTGLPSGVYACASTNGSGSFRILVVNTNPTAVAWSLNSNTSCTIMELSDENPSATESSFKNSWGILPPYGVHLVKYSL